MRTTLAVVAVLLAACADTSDTQETVEGEVTVDESSPTRIAGVYTHGDDDIVEFEAREVEPKLVTITLKLHGMTLDATLDTRDGNRMWSQDAFATATGEDTVIAENDIELIASFVRGVEAAGIGVSQGDGLAFHFGAVINLWAQWIPAMDPVRIKFEDRERAVDMCWWASAADRYHSYDGHDCSTCSGDPSQGQGQSSCSSYGAYGPYYSPTYYFHSGGWHTSPSGHGNGSYMIGDCFGRYGAGCGSGNAYFQENGSHDHCVRNNHNIASSWCSDELWNTTQPYNCW